MVIKIKHMDANDDDESHNEQQKQGYKHKIYAIVEMLDDMIPVVGKLMDIPVVDALEQKLVDALVDTVFNIKFTAADCEKIMCFST
jgi:hypothetical protein